MVQYSVQRQGASSTSIQNNATERKRADSVKSPNHTEEYESKSDAGSYWENDGTPTKNKTRSTSQASGHATYSEDRKAKRKTTGPLHNSKYKAKLCKNWTKNGFCQYYEKCQFAHGSQELEKWARHRAKYQAEMNGERYSESKSPSAESQCSTHHQQHKPKSASPSPSTKSHHTSETSHTVKDLESSFTSVASAKGDTLSGKTTPTDATQTIPTLDFQHVASTPTTNATNPNGSMLFTSPNGYITQSPGSQGNVLGDQGFVSPSPGMMQQNQPQTFNPANVPLNSYAPPPQPNMFQPVHPHPQNHIHTHTHQVQQPLAQRGVPNAAMQFSPMVGGNSTPGPSPSNDWLLNGNDAQRERPWSTVSRSSPTDLPSPGSTSSFRSYSCIQQLNESPTMFSDQQLIAEITSMPFSFLNLDPVDETH